MQFKSSTLFQIVAVAAVTFWFLFPPSPLKVVPTIFLIALFGSLNKPTLIRGMLIGLLAAGIMMVLYWAVAYLDLYFPRTRSRPPEAPFLEIVVIPLVLLVAIFGPVAGAIGMLAGIVGYCIREVTKRFSSLAD